MQWFKNLFLGNELARQDAEVDYVAEQYKSALGITGGSVHGLDSAIKNVTRAMMFGQEEGGIVTTHDVELILHHLNRRGITDQTGINQPLAVIYTFTNLRRSNGTKAALPNDLIPLQLGFAKWDEEYRKQNANINRTAYCHYCGGLIEGDKCGGCGASRRKALS